MAQVHYKVKRIDFMKRRVPIMMQNENGPCPLLALANVMLLRNHISLPSSTDSVSQERLISLVAGRMLDANDENTLARMPADHAASLQQNLSDAISHLPKLATGVDVNPRFTGTGSFEFTRDIAIFDLLDIRLVHGWLVDPQDQETLEAVGNMSYNELISALVALSGNDPSSIPSSEQSPPEQATSQAKDSALSENNSIDKQQHHQPVSTSLDAADALELEMALKLSLEDPSATQSSLLGQAALLVPESSRTAGTSLSSETALAAPKSGYAAGNNDPGARENKDQSSAGPPLQPEQSLQSPSASKNPSTTQSEQTPSQHSSTKTKGVLQEEQELQEALRLSEAEFLKAQSPAAVPASSPRQTQQSPASVRPRIPSENCAQATSPAQSLDPDERAPGNLSSSLPATDPRTIPEGSPVFNNPVFGSPIPDSAMLQQNTPTEQVASPQSEISSPSAEEPGIKVVDTSRLQSGAAPPDQNLEELAAAVHDCILGDGLSGAAVNATDTTSTQLGVDPDETLTTGSALPSQLNAGASSSPPIQSQCGASAQDLPSSSGFGEASRLARLQDSDRGENEADLQRLDSLTRAKGKMVAYSTQRDHARDQAQAGPQQKEGDGIEGEAAEGSTTEQGLEDQNVVLARARLIKAFLDKHSSQLTEFGIVCLHQDLRSNELGILFRNNHFTTIFLHNGRLWMLATDQGFLYEQDIVWEALSDVGGNNNFVDSTFQQFRAHSAGSPLVGPAGTSSEADMALALQLQEEENVRQQQFFADQRQHEHQLTKERRPSNQSQYSGREPRSIQTRHSEEPEQARMRQARLREEEKQASMSQARRREEEKKKGRCTIM